MSVKRYLFGGGPMTGDTMREFVSSDDYAALEAELAAAQREAKVAKRALVLASEHLDVGDGTKPLWVESLLRDAARALAAEEITPTTSVQWDKEGTFEERKQAALDAAEEQAQMIEYRCKDGPEANGRLPQKGEHRFSLLFPLENGEELKVHMGRESMNHFKTFIAQMMIDDSVEQSNER